MSEEGLAVAIALAALAARHPREAWLVREWAAALEVDGACGPAAVKALSPGMGEKDDLLVVQAVEEAARTLGLVPGAGPHGYIRLPSSMRSKGKKGARKRYYMRRWTWQGNGLGTECGS